MNTPAIMKANPFQNVTDELLRSLLQAGIVLAIALVAWLVVHYAIRLFVKRAEKQTWAQRGLGWARPMLSNIDPFIKALENERKVQRAKTIGTLFNSSLTLVVIVIAGFYVLLAFGVNITPLVASVGVVGISIGFGSQQLIRDFLAGIFIALEDQYGIGDVIQTSEVIGRVEYVGLRITRVMGEDGTLWYLRNGEIMRLGNRSKGDYKAPDAPTEPDHSSEASE